MRLASALADYDGKRTESLEIFLGSHGPDATLLSQLVDLSLGENRNDANGASWLLKAYLTQGAELAPEVVAALIHGAADVVEPWAQLHICQSIRFITVPTDSAESLGRFLESCRSAPRPFLRAWATDGLQALAAQHPEYEGAAAAALKEALEDPAASVRARARRILNGD